MEGTNWKALSLPYMLVGNFLNPNFRQQFHSHKHLSFSSSSSSPSFLSYNLKIDLNSTEWYTRIHNAAHKSRTSAVLIALTSLFLSPNCQNYLNKKNSSWEWWWQSLYFMITFECLLPAWIAFCNIKLLQTRWSIKYRWSLRMKPRVRQTAALLQWLAVNIPDVPKPTGRLVINFGNIDPLLKPEISYTACSNTRLGNKFQFASTPKWMGAHELPKASSLIQQNQPNHNYYCNISTRERMPWKFFTSTYTILFTICSLNNSSSRALSLSPLSYLVMIAMYSEESSS